jgi:hypothetical protein
MTRHEPENGEARDARMLHVIGFKSDRRLDSLDSIARYTTQVIEVRRFDSDSSPISERSDSSNYYSTVITPPPGSGPLVPAKMLPVKP